MNDDKAPDLVGTPSYDNWRAYLSGAPRLGGYEYILYSDAQLIGGVETGVEPYAFMNLVPFERERGCVKTAVAVRVWVHVAFDTPRMDRTEQSRYHGGDADDEVAALASLACGTRFRAGNTTRRFEVAGDPMGRPIAWGGRPIPILGIGLHGFVLPEVAGVRSLLPVERLSSFPRLAPLEAITLVRVSRLYQDALWLAESEPNLSWLLLVSAIETAANLWRTGKDAPLDRLTEARPDLVEYLESEASCSVATRVAEEFSDSIGATKKLVEFLLEYIPPPPPVRPAKWGQIEWNTESFRRSFRQIYTYRSRALHDGMPLPAPMSSPPFRHESWEAFAERPIGLAMSGRGGTWLAKDTPMLLHTFEYITRNALCAWWSAMVATRGSAQTA